MKKGKIQKVLMVFLSVLLFAACNKVQSQEGAKDEVFKEVDVMPEFPGGMEGLIAYMQEHIVYPEEAKESGLEGQVFVEFVVTAKGEVVGAEVKRGVSDPLDRVAVKAVADMPDWTPGEKDGKQVNVSMILPVSFLQPDK